MGCNSSKGPRQEQSRAPRLQPPAGRPAAPAQSLTRVKLVLLGATGVGKSCLVLRYVKGLFEAASRVTVGAAFLAHSVALPDGRTVKFEIWDTAGQERYASLAPLYYRGAGAAVVMYDITSAETFTKAKYWVTELQKNAPGNLVIVLAGNKSDLAEHRQVTTEEGEAYAASNSMMFLETSAKTAANVATVFDVIARTLGGAGAPPSGPSVRTAPPSAATHSPSKQPTHRSQQSSTPQKPPQDPSTASATLPADARRPQHAQSGKGLQDSTESLASNQSAASMASDGAGEPLPPSSDAAVLDAPSLSSKPSSTPRASIHNAAPSGTQPSKEVHAPTTPAPAQGHSSAKNGTASEAAKAQGDLLGTDDATGGDGEMDLPAAPRKAEPKAEVEEAADAAHESTALPHDAAPRKAERKAEVDKAADDAHESAAPTNDAAGQQQGSVTAAGSNPSKPLDDQAPKEQAAAKLKPSDAAAKDDRAEAADKGAEDSQDRAQ